MEQAETGAALVVEIGGDEKGRDESRAAFVAPAEPCRRQALGGQLYPHHFGSDFSFTTTKASASLAGYSHWDLAIALLFLRCWRTTKFGGQTNMRSCDLSSRSKCGLMELHALTALVLAGLLPRLTVSWSRT